MKTLNLNLRRILRETKEPGILLKDNLLTTLNSLKDKISAIAEEDGDAFFSALDGAGLKKSGDSLFQSAVVDESETKKAQERWTELGGGGSSSSEPKPSPAAAPASSAPEKKGTDGADPKPADAPKPSSPSKAEPTAPSSTPSSKGGDTNPFESFGAPSSGSEPGGKKGTDAPSATPSNPGGFGGGEDDNKSEFDSLYDQAVKEAIKLAGNSGEVSKLTSLIQKKLNIGFNAAAKVVDQMEENGILGPRNPQGVQKLLSDKTKQSETPKPSGSDSKPSGSGDAGSKGKSGGGGDIGQQIAEIMNKEYEKGQDRKPVSVIESIKGLPGVESVEKQNPWALIKTNNTLFLVPYNYAPSESTSFLTRAYHLNERNNPVYHIDLVASTKLEAFGDGKIDVETAVASSGFTKGKMYIPTDEALNAAASR